MINQFKNDANEIVESVFRFGPKQGLLGILSEPIEEQCDVNLPTVVLFNAGIVHRVGPFRMNVDIARQLSRSGFRCLRMDLSGLGDSGMRSGKLNSQERAMLDAKDAFDSLVELGSEEFVALGLCSGAFNAFQSALHDPRVVGLVSIDGVAFPTEGFRRREVTRKMNFRFVRNAIKRRLVGGDSDAANAGEALAESEFFSVEENPDRCRSQFHELQNRGVKMNFIYTGGFEEFNGEPQFEEMFVANPNDQIQLSYFAESEHTFPIVDHRRLLVRNVCDWASRAF